MPDGATPYNRWPGELAQTSRFGVVFEGEIRRVLRSNWGLLSVLLGLAIGLAFIGQLFDFRQRGVALQLDHFVSMVDMVLWGGLAVAAITGTTALLLDKQHGALDLYFTRSLTPREYLLGKSLAQFTLATGVVFAPVIVYMLVALLVIGVDGLPEGWALWIPWGLAVAAGWGLLVTGLALGISAVGRSAAGAVVVLAGAFLIAEVLLWRMLEGLTDSVYAALISPLAGARQLNAWLMGHTLPYGFEPHWAAIVWGFLVFLGWGLFIWRRPRVRGVEEVSE